MDTMTRSRIPTSRTADLDGEVLPLRVVVETPEHEQIELGGCSEAEVEAKLHDYLAWAS